MRFVYLIELHIGPKDMVTIPSSSLELAKRERTSYVFKLCCLCLEHVLPRMLCVTLRCHGESTVEVDLSDIIQPLQSFILNSGAEQNIFTSAESISSCVELLDEFAYKAIQPCYDHWPSVDIHDKSQIHADLTKAYKNVTLALNAETGVEVSVSPETPKKLAPNDVNVHKNLGLMGVNFQKLLLQKFCLRNSVCLVFGTSGDAC